MMKRIGFAGLAFALYIIVEGATSARSQGAPPNVTYLVTGSANNWTLNFTLKSNFVSGEGVSISSVSSYRHATSREVLPAGIRMPMAVGITALMEAPLLTTTMTGSIPI